MEPAIVGDHVAEGEEAVRIPGPSEKDGIKIAIIGRPNVGKSTLVNRMLGEDRVIVYDQPGTTRDSIYIPFERNDEKYTLIDTAGVRKRGKIHEEVEKFSVVKTLQAIKDANVVIFVMDAREGVVDHDLNLLGFALEAGRALVIAINKWDGMTPSERDFVKVELQRRLFFVDFAGLSVRSEADIARLLEAVGASKVGSAMLYVLVATIGMHMDLGALLDRPWLFLLGLIWIGVHACLMLGMAKLIRAPLFFMAVGSQANIGGAASAPVVASAFHPALAPVGVLLAVLGYALGTYCAYLTGIALRVLAA